MLLYYFIDKRVQHGESNQNKCPYCQKQVLESPATYFKISLTGDQKREINLLLEAVDSHPSATGIIIY